MSRITACPQCQTRFRVTEAQLQMRGGRVRCGRCEHVFNALETLLEELPLPAEPQPRLAEPAMAFFPDQGATGIPEPEIQPDETSLPEASSAKNEAPEPPFEPEIAQPEARADSAVLPPEYPAVSPPGKEITVPEAVAEHALDELAALEPKPEPESKPEARVVRIQPPPVIIQPKVSPASPKYAPPPKPKRAWPWVLANLLLLTGLAGQSIYSFRDAIAAHYPLTRPLLEQACASLQCRVSLPRNPDLISIESSELNADPARANIVVLTSVLRNRASHVQAYPTLELTLTNARDEMVARILFTPKKYLRNPASIPLGIPASGEVAVKLLMDLGELKAEGYRLYLFYPPQQ